MSSKHTKYNLPKQTYVPISGAAAAIEVMGEVGEREGRGPAVRWPAGDGAVATPRGGIRGGHAGSGHAGLPLRCYLRCFLLLLAASSPPQVGNQGLQFFSFVCLILRWIHRVCKLAYPLCTFFLWQGSWCKGLICCLGFDLYKKNRAHLLDAGAALLCSTKKRWFIASAAICC
jgi:hypothetical protein